MLFWYIFGPKLATFKKQRGEIKHLGIGRDNLGEEEEEEVERKVGPKPKPFSELGQLQKRRVTQNVFDSAKNVAVERETELVNITGYMLKRLSLSQELLVT